MSEYNKRFYDENINNLTQSLIKTNATMQEFRDCMKDCVNELKNISEKIKEHDIILLGNDRVSGHVKDIVVLKNTISVLKWVMATILSCIGLVLAFFKNRG